VINDGGLPYLNELVYKTKAGIKNSSIEIVTKSPTNKFQKAIDITPRLLSKVRKKGVIRSAKLATSIARTHIKKRKSISQHRRYIFISHPIDRTGAPLVLLQVIEEFAYKFGGKNIQLVAPGIQSEQERKMHELGVNVDKAVFGLGFRFIRLQLGLNSNDFVLMNTVAIYDNYRDFIMLWLRTGRLKHAYWFIHEDKAQLPVIHKEFLDAKNIEQTHNLIVNKKLTVLVPSERTKQEYDQLLDVKTVLPIKLHVEVDKRYHIVRKPSDYHNINFMLQGTPSDGRKGHMIALAAFHEFLNTYYEKDPKKYRDFTLHFVSIGDDYISQQVRNIGLSILGQRLKLYPSVPKAEVLDLYAKCNAVICCSLNETFGLYVAECMFMGHVVLRNNSAGMDEQLKDGKNGYFIDHNDIKQFASVIEKVLNIKTNSNERLMQMGEVSQEIIENYGRNNYLEQIEQLGLK